LGRDGRGDSILNDESILNDDSDSRPLANAPPPTETGTDIDESPPTRLTLELGPPADDQDPKVSRACLGRALLLAPPTRALDEEVIVSDEVECSRALGPLGSIEAGLGMPEEEGLGSWETEGFNAEGGPAGRALRAELG